jgi:L-alanine-DL-glutamate epimerase-like enolase superfamily enzyme
MKITHLRVRHEDLELTRPYTIAYKSVDSVSSCIVELETDTGHVGWGAANPSKAVVGVDVNDTLAALSDDATAWLVGADGRDLRQLCRRVQQQLANQPGAAAALDMALHDLFAQHLEVPLTRYLGQCHNSLPTSITIGIKNVADTLAEAEEYVGRGFTYLKVKLGHSSEEDVERLAKLREALGDKIVIRVDANQGYSFEQLEEFYRQTRALHLELIEQPLPVAQTDDYRRLPDEIKRLIALDESLVRPADAAQLVAPPGAGGIFNIKLMKCGGLTPAREIATIAKHAGVDLMWGCNDESIISIAAALHLALATPHTRYLDLDGSLDLARDVVTGGFVLRDGRLSVTGVPGLGVKEA